MKFTSTLLTITLLATSHTSCTDTSEPTTPFYAQLNQNAPEPLRGKKLTIEFAFTDKELREDPDYRILHETSWYLDHHTPAPERIVYFGKDSKGHVHYALLEWMEIITESAVDPIKKWLAKQDK